MTQPLEGERIALFEARLAEEIAHLVRRSGAVPVSIPAVRERRRAVADEVAALLGALDAEPSPAFVLSTGVGVAALFDEARALGRGAGLRDALARGVCICRGPKPLAALYREGVAAAVRVRPPYTTAELVEAIDGVDLRARLTVLLHYGERSEPLVEALASRGPRLRELTLYAWELPEDRGPLRRAVEEIASGSFSAVAFTSQIQARHLLSVAEEMGAKEALLGAVRSKTVVAAVGPTCARVLRELGIEPEVVPESPKMAPMVNALVHRLARGKAR